ncbi:MAG: 2-amino-4-hydroxy-6-hydroxymethyldihydropteridine diphosphokinase [Bacteroidaceae bacterium]|jgi:2-amino-4-hydroxy-6-hydroxymethyldihydropteridine diphosphokinase|nr:2-amino-4-hydroxy-6-hydroxymethyldihydropteridine diphosphokinase [Bacteroidaceae bacterium]
MHVVFLSLGTNLGDKTKNLNDAINQIERRVGSVKAKSAFIQTEPWGFKSENTFLNAAIKVETILSPIDLLIQTQRIERDLGRISKSINGEYHDRIIDIDILLYFEDGNIIGDGLHIESPELTIPHPHMNERDFVTIPLKQIL